MPSRSRRSEVGAAEAGEEAGVVAAEEAVAEEADKQARS